MKHILTGTFCLCGALAVASAQGAGLAPLPDRGRKVQSVSITYKDIDLNNQAGAAALYARLKTAARHVCGKPDLRDLRAVQDWRSCRADALDHAVAKIDHPQLTALHHQPDEVKELLGFNLRPAVQR